MRYFGGKFRLRKEISSFLEGIRETNQVFIDMFCGACNITMEMSGIRFAFDGSECLINMYKSLLNGWIPPKYLSEEEWNVLKDKKDVNNPLTAFAGFGCSFSGMWFAKCSVQYLDQNLVEQTRNSLLRLIEKCGDVHFRNYDFFKLVVNKNMKNNLIYCDPPYRNARYLGNYDMDTEFNHDRFWKFVRYLSKDNTCVVSELTAPDDFISVKEMAHKYECNHLIGSKQVTEKLFMYSKYL